MNGRKTLDRTVLTFAVLGSLVLVNVLGLALFTRIDLTHDRQFTLSDTTRAMLRDLHEPITVRAYFTQDLPPPYATNARFVRDLLDEYYTQAHGKLRFEFIDPTADESAEDKEKKKDTQQDIFGRTVRQATTMERELEEAGVPPVQVRVNDADKVEVKRAYMGLVVQYGEQKEVIPVVSESAGLEYNLTTLMRKLVRAKPFKVGLVTGHGGLSPQTDYGRAYAALQAMYTVSDVDLTQSAVPADVDTLLVIGPGTAFTEAEKRAFDAYLTAGHSAGVFLGPIKPSLQDLQFTPNTPELEPLLASYGVQLGHDLLVDAECATINVTRQAGGMQIAQPIRYPLLPLLRSLENHPATRNLGQVVFAFSSGIDVKPPEGSNVRIDVLAKSSPTTYAQPAPYNLDPAQHWEVPAGQTAQVHSLMVALAGDIKSAYASDASTAPAADKQSRLLVAGSASLFADPFFGKPHETMLLNLVDWLVRDDDLLAVRARGLNPAPLQEVSDAGRNVSKYGNIVGLPLTLVGVGLVRWRRREARRQKITL